MRPMKCTVIQNRSLPHAALKSEHFSWPILKQIKGNGKINLTQNKLYFVVFLFSAVRCIISSALTFYKDKLFVFIIFLSSLYEYFFYILFIV